MMEDGDQAAAKNKQGTSRYSYQRLWGEGELSMVMPVEWPQSSNSGSGSTAEGKFIVIIHGVKMAVGGREPGAGSKELLIRPI